MPSATDRLEFAPPAQPGLLRAFGLAIVAHMLLMLALTWGINWKRESTSLSAEAELWSAVPQQAAPKPVEAAPPPPPPPPPEKIAPTPPPPPVVRDADIALEREKKKQAEAKRQEELERQKKLAEKKKQDEAKKQELAQKAADEKKKAEAARQAKAEDIRKAEEKRRQENIARAQSLAGATGAPDATGTAQRSSGPSDSYGGRIRARVRPNIVFTDDVPGNPTAEVEVRMAPDGTITGKRVVKSSGVKSWDEAVLRALDKTEILPRDVDGRVHSPLIIEFRPRG